MSYNNGIKDQGSQHINSNIIFLVENIQILSSYS